CQGSNYTRNPAVAFRDLKWIVWCVTLRIHPLLSRTCISQGRRGRCIRNRAVSEFMEPQPGNAKVSFWYFRCLSMGEPNHGWGMGPESEATLWTFIGQEVQK